MTPESAQNPLSREQRIRKQAELQRLYTTLNNLRERETSYIDTSARTPLLFNNQVDDVRQQIIALEQELAVGSQADAAESKGRALYAEGFAAELSAELDKAVGLYKKAARYSHPDATPAVRSVRYKIKRGRTRTTEIYLPSGTRSKRSRWLVWLAMLMVAIVLFVVLWLNFPAQETTQPVVTALETEISPTVVVQLVVPNTPTPRATSTFRAVLATATQTPAPPTPTPAAATVEAPPTAPPTATDVPTSVPTLGPPPGLIDPKDGLVWLDGAVVFEFKRQELAFDEQYCITSIRGYDINGAENWSYQSVGSKSPSIVIEAHVFRVAKVQGMQCVTWSAGIGKGSCENIVSQTTPPRIIGLPRPCDF
jgi:anti-sigma-K factor RskA